MKVSFGRTRRVKWWTVLDPHLIVGGVVTVLYMIWYVVVKLLDLKGW